MNIQFWQMSPIFLIGQFEQISYGLSINLARLACGRKKIKNLMLERTQLAIS